MDRPLFFDKKGKPLTLAEAESLLPDTSYCRVAEDIVGNYWISTIWLGADYNWSGRGLPIIFETMVFTIKDGKLDTVLHEYLERYCTEQEAQEGHSRMVRELSQVQSKMEDEPAEATNGEDVEKRPNGGPAS